MALEKFSFREVRARPLRAFLTLMSIAAGVAAVVAVLLATSTTRATQKAMFQAIAGRTDLEVVSDGVTGFAYNNLAKVREKQFVQVATPSLNRFAVLFAGDNKARTQVLGIDPRIDQKIRDYELTSGRLPTALNEIYMDGSFAESLSIKLDDEVKILGRGGLETFRVVGFVRPTGAGAIALSSAVYMVLPAAQKTFRTGANIDLIQIVLKQDTDKKIALEELSKIVPRYLTVRPPSNNNEMSRETMFATENGLHMSIAFALIIAVFIIYNTFLMSVGERKKQIGILRAVGATRSQIRWTILREAILFSVIGSSIGCVLGVFGAQYISQATQQLLQVRLPVVQLSLWPFVIAVSFGVIVSLLGALLPARKAASVQPIEAIRAVDLQEGNALIRITRPLALFSFLVGFIGLFFAIRNLLPLGSDVVAIVFILFGVVLIIPTLLTPITNIVASLMQPWFGVEARLAQKQLLRHTGRTTLTIGVLFVAIAASTGMAGNILDNVQNVRDWYQRTIVGDFFVRASMPDLATGTAASIPENIGAQLAAIDGIQSIDPMRFVQGQTEDNSVLIVVRNFKDESSSFFDIVEGDAASALTAMRNGKVVIGSVLAQRQRLKLGDTITLRTGSITKEMEIAAVTNDYMGGGLTVYLQEDIAARGFNISGVDAYVINASESNLEEVENALQTLCKENGLILQSYSQLVGFIDKMVSGIIASLWALLAIGCVIAAMGLVNTLTMSILEQTREIGMLRVVAMTRTQVRKMILAQAVLLGIIGLIPGALLGIFVAFAISLSAEAILGHDVAFHFRPNVVFGCLFGGLFTVIIASLLPAERAARLNMSDAMRYE